jgi:hypothetical protein
MKLFHDPIEIVKTKTSLNKKNGHVSSNTFGKETIYAKVSQRLKKSEAYLFSLVESKKNDLR